MEKFSYLKTPAAWLWIFPPAVQCLVCRTIPSCRSHVFVITQEEWEETSACQHAAERRKEITKGTAASRKGFSNSPLAAVSLQRARWTTRPLYQPEKRLTIQISLPPLISGGGTFGKRWHISSFVKMCCEPGFINRCLDIYVWSFHSCAHTHVTSVAELLFAASDRRCQLVLANFEHVIIEELVHNGVHLFATRFPPIILPLFSCICCTW